MGQVTVRRGPDLDVDELSIANLLMFRQSGFPLGEPNRLAHLQIRWHKIMILRQMERPATIDYPDNWSGIRRRRLL